MARAQSTNRGRGRRRGPDEATAPSTEGTPAQPARAEDSRLRCLVLFKEDAVDAGAALLQDRLGLNVPRAGQPGAALFPTDQGIILDRLGVAVVPLETDQHHAFEDAGPNSPVLLVRPEGVMEPLSGLPAQPAWSADYLRGYRDGVVHLVDRDTVPPTVQGINAEYLRGYRDGVARLIDGLLPAAAAGTVPALPATVEDTAAEAEATWGLRATGVLDSPFTGRGVAVAVLDTGIDLRHPDFANGRIKASASFILGEGVQDKHGHGTHCAGTACGPLRPAHGPRYGVAPEAELFVGKVLDNTGQGPEGSILAGLDWALGQGCRVLLLPFGMLPAGAPAAAFYQEVGRRAVKAGAAVIAAAGGHSNRALKLVQPVCIPANGVTILGVGAVKRDLDLANFSNGGGPQGLGGVDLVAPGVNVISSWPLPHRTRKVSGTSTAAAHVAGIAALISQSLEGEGAAGRSCTPQEIYNALLLSARPLPHASTDAGKGLVQAPRAALGVAPNVGQLV